MKSSAFSQGIIRYASGAFVDFLTRIGLSRNRLSIALECVALIIVWSAAIAMSLAVAVAVFGEQ